MALSALRAADPKWHEYTSKEGKFRVLFPTKPKEMETKSGSLLIHRAQTNRTTVDGLSFSCSWMIKEKPFAEEGAKDVFLLAHQQGFVRTSKGKLIETKALAVDGNRAREYIVRVSNVDTVRCRAICCDRHCYTLQVWGKDTGAVRSADAEKFLKAFTLVGERAKAAKSDPGP